MHRVDLFSEERRTALKKLGVFISASMLIHTPTIAASPRRIVSIGGAITEIVFALQANTELVGVDTTSTYPKQAQQLPNVGYARSLSTEGVLALAPDMVIATGEAGPPSVLKQLSATGIPVNILATNYRFDGLLERVKRVGELTGRTRQAAALQQTLTREWQQTQIAQRPTGKVRVLFILSPTPNQIMVAGRETSAQAMLNYAGVANAADQFSGYKPLTPEAVIAAQPDIILTTSQGLAAMGGVAGLLKIPGLMQTPAGRHQRVISLDTMLLLGFGPRLPSAVTELNAAMVKAMQA